MTRNSARTEILQTANNYMLHMARVRYAMAPVLLNMRQINQAVCVCRHNQLVKPEVYRWAGFKDNGGRKAPKRTLFPTRKQWEIMNADTRNPSLPDRDTGISV